MPAQNHTAIDLGPNRRADVEPLTILIMAQDHVETVCLQCLANVSDDLVIGPSRQARKSDKTLQNLNCVGQTVVHARFLGFSQGGTLGWQHAILPEDCHCNRTIADR